MTLSDDKWEEIEPCVYQLRAYTPEQIECLSRRPTEWISEILKAVRGLALSLQKCGPEK